MTFLVIRFIEGNRTERIIALFLLVSKKGGNMRESNRERLERVLSNSLSGIENKVIIERVVGKVVKEGDDLIEIEKQCQLDENGGIQEIHIFKIKTYACGCRANGRNNFGGIDFKGNVVCAKHYYRCIRCRKPLSILTVKAINGIAYCPSCARITKILRFFGLKK